MKICIIRSRRACPAVCHGDDFRSDFANILAEHKFELRTKEITPKLVDAKVGNFVLIYSDYKHTDAESPVGIVASKETADDGRFCYGVRYIRPTLNNNFSRSLNSFEITAENYGGYQWGFLKVLTPDELASHLNQKIEGDYKEAQSSLETKYLEAKRTIPRLIDRLMTGKKRNIESWGVEAGGPIPEDMEKPNPKTVP